MKKWKLGFEVLIICFFALIWFAFYLEKQNEQEDQDQYPDNSESSENDVEDRLIIVSTDDKRKEQEDEFLLPADSVKKIVLELSCEDHVTQENNEDVTTEQDTWENAQQAYEEFVDGKRGACGMDMLELATPTGEPNRRYATEYVIIDSNGDGIPELHTRTGREFYAFTYRNDQMEILAGYFSNPTHYTLLTDGSFIYREDRGTTRGNYYRKFRLDAEGEEIDKTEFWWIDTNKNLVMDENDEYGFDDAECTKEEWLFRTADYIYIDNEDWEHYCNEVEWTTYCEAR